MVIFHLLEAFCKVASCGSITKAARTLNISQPALSLQIQELERNLQTVLFTRSNKGVKLTETGEIVLNYCNKIINLGNNMQAEINKYQSSYAEELVVGASCTVGNFALPCSIYVFQEQHPGHPVKLEISTTLSVLEQMLEGSLNAAVVEGPIPDFLKIRFKTENLAYKKIASDKLIVVTPYNEKWEKKNTLLFSELSEQALILREKGCGIRETIQSTFQRLNLDIAELDIHLELNSIGAIVSSVAANRGISILPRMAVRKELRHRTLKALSVENLVFHHNFYLVHRPLHQKDSLAKAFIEFILSPERSFC